MDKMSIWSMIFVSFPEELLIVVITLAAAGYIDVLNFKKRENILKLFSATVLTVITNSLCRIFLSSATLNFVIQTILIFSSIIIIYRYKVLACILGFLLSMTIYIVSESLLVIPLMKALNISLTQLYSNDLVRILVSLPDRITQIIAVIVICKIRNINLKMLKLTLNEWIQIILFFLIIVSSMVSIESGIRNIDRDVSTILKLIVNIAIAVLFSFFMIYNIFKLRKRIFLKENIHQVELHHIKQLLEENRTDYAIELIDLTLQERGYYLKQ